MGLEVELKYRAAGREPLLRLATMPALGPAELGEARTVEESDRYLDTPGGRLAAAGWACRLRRRDGVSRLSLKGPRTEPIAGGVHRRPELEALVDDGADPDSWPASGARALLDRLSMGEPLVERMELVQRRTERAVRAEGHHVGLLTLDEVEVRHDGRSHGRFEMVEVEVEVAGAGDARGEALLPELAAALDRIDGLVREERTKLELGLELVAA